MAVKQELATAKRLAAEAAVNVLCSLRTDRKPSLEEIGLGTKDALLRFLLFVGEEYLSTPCSAMIDLTRDVQDYGSTDLVESALTPVSEREACLPRLLGVLSSAISAALSQDMTPPGSSEHSLAHHLLTLCTENGFWLLPSGAQLISSDPSLSPSTSSRVNFNLARWLIDMGTPPF